MTIYDEMKALTVSTADIKAMSDADLDVLNQKQASLRSRIWTQKYIRPSTATLNFSRSADAVHTERRTRKSLIKT